MCSLSSRTCCQYFAVMMWPSGWAKLCSTALGLPVVPLVKYMSMMSLEVTAASPVGRSKVSGNPAMRSSKSTQPSRLPSTMNFSRTVGQSGMACSTWVHT